MRNILVLLIFATLLASCDTGFYSKGLVIDKLTRLPIDSVKISIKELDSTYTDSLGRYMISKFIYGQAGDFEILLEKKGYEIKHINFETSQIKKDSAIIELKKLVNKSESYCLNKKTISIMYYFDKYFISLLNILTLLFLLLKKIKWKVFWIIGILLINLTLFFSFTDCSLMKIKFINGPVYLTHYWMYPYSVKIVIPIITIIFWIIYLIKRKSTIKDPY